MGVLLLIYFPSLNIGRQCLAASLVFFSTIYLCKTQYCKYVFLILLASMIHTSAVSGLFLLIIKFITAKIEKTSICVLVVMLLIILLCVLLGIYGEEFIPERYFSYIDEHIVVSNKELLVLSKIGFLFLILYSANDTNRFFTLCCVVGLVVDFISINYAVLMRMSIYWELYFLLLLPDFVNKINNSVTNLGERTMFLFGSFGYLLGLIVCTFFIFNHGGIVPYDVF